MKPKLFLLYCWLCLLPATATAQEPGTVYLRDGGFIRGRITERHDGGVLLVTPRGRSYIFRFDEINKDRFWYAWPSPSIYPVISDSFHSSSSQLFPSRSAYARPPCFERA